VGGEFLRQNITDVVGQMSNSGLHVICVVDSASEDGGASQTALSTAVELARRGVTVTLFTGLGPVSSLLSGIPNLSVICLNQKHILHNSNRIEAATQGLWNFEAAACLRRVLGSSPRGRTVIHIHTWLKCLSNSVLSEAVASRLPTVITAHGFELACPIGSLFRTDTNAACNLRPMSAACAFCNCDPRNYGHKLWRLTRQLIQVRITDAPGAVDAVVVGSKSAGDRLYPYLPKGSQLHVIPPAIEMDAPPSVEPPADDAPLCFVGRFSKEKGAHLWARAARTLDIPTVFIGDGPMRAELESLCPRARFTGWLPFEEVHRHIRESKGIVFPSTCLETYGRVVAEAAALGRGAIVADACAAADLVADGETGFHFRTGDVDSLCDKTRQFLSLGTPARLGAAAFRRYWDDPSTLELHGSRILTLYNKLLDQRNRADEM
jgi:glycosyltransferase involved in cell wall biosynthesis